MSCPPDAASGRGERCRPPVLVHEDARDTARLHGRSEVLDVLGGEDLRDLCFERPQFVDGVEVVDLGGLD